MQLLTTLLSGALLCGQGLCAEDPACTPLPGDFIFGEPVPMVPADIPPGCSDYEVLVARGTSEPNFDEGGRFGVIVGDPIVSNLTEALPGVQGYHVQYPADISFVDNIVIGGNDIVSRIQAQDVMCPNQLFALVGYSQGAGVVHKALELLPSNLQSKVRSVSVFGDPSKGLNDGDIWPSDWPYGFESKIHDVCAVGDPICDTSQTCLYWHLTYIRPFYIYTAVDFIVEKFVNNFNVLPIQSDDDSSV